jgi:AcrR family transcriptional regulator
VGRAASPTAAARARRVRDQVLDCAERVFAERGYHASKMGEVAGLAGVSLSTVYASFPSKRDLFEALHEKRGRAFLARLQPALRSGEPVLVCLRRAVSAFVDWLVQHRNYLRVDLREGRSWAIGDVEASRSFQSGIGLWTRLVERGIREGVFCDEDPRLLATTAFAIMQVQLAVLLERGEPATPEAIADRITRQLERALCAPTATPRRVTPNRRRTS